MRFQNARHVHRNSAPTQEQPSVRAFCAAESAVADEVCRTVGYVSMSQFTIANVSVDEVKKLSADARTWLTGQRYCRSADPKGG